MKTYLFIYSLLSLSFLQLSFAQGGSYIPCGASRCPPSPADKTFMFDVGDVNGDGLYDYIQRPRTAPATCDQDQTYLYVSGGANRFLKYRLPCDLGFKGEQTKILFGDFNGDGKQDIIRRSADSSPPDLLFYTGSGNFDKIPLSDFELRSDFTIVHIGDFNGDCKDDFLRQETTGWDYDRQKTCHVYMSNGDGTFQKIYVSEADDRAYMPGTYTNLYIGDFDGDGKDDIFRQEKSTFDDDDLRTGTFLLSNGDGTFTLKSLPESLNLKGDHTKIYLGDFNGDCITDILRQSVCNGDTCPPATVLISDSNADLTPFILPDNYNIEGQYTNLYVGDFNCDRRSDFVKQENGQRPGSDVASLETFVSIGDESNYFNNVDLFAPSVFRSDVPSDLFVAEFTGDTRSDIMQYWGGNCVEFSYAPKEGSCQADQCNRCQRSQNDEL